MTAVGLARARRAVDKQGSSWETYGRGRQACSVAWLLLHGKAHCPRDGSNLGARGSVLPVDRSPMD